ncbi:hypothetical protein [Parabacteroides sp. AF17-28]|jgi:hypothetical protein|uniref:hypothetical protein n=1 Tax=Parabacteroides sp. AF17-28 TaxID=2292241 RepID=UPI000EFE4FF2|nr:hypothetical protein [Parabacteroides sp. AF17-28]RHR62675.1 hypothetical protein DWW90_00130 [Parabacteroides sp. AF17-28]
MTFKEFKDICKAFYDANKVAQGYEMYDISEFSDTCFHFEVYQRGEWTLMLDYSMIEANKDHTCMLYENFENGDPQRVYGYYSRVGDALNSMLKGSSLNDRKPIELYY